MSGLRWLLCGLSELLESDASLAFGQEERPAGQTSASGPHPVCTLLCTPSGTLLCRYKRASFLQEGRIEEPQFLLILRFLKMRNLILLLLCLFGGHILGFTMSF